VEDALRQAEADPDEWNVSEQLKQAWAQAGKVRAWQRNKRKELERKLQPTLAEAFKAEYAEANPSKPALEGKLSEEHQAVVDGRVLDRTKQDMEKAVAEAKKKCAFLLMFDVGDATVPLDTSGLAAQNFASRWQDWDNKYAPNAKASRPVEEADHATEKRDRIQDELLQIAQADVTAQELQDFTEAG
jgi:hypothetical protein